jgi:hypothetical protein
MKGEKLAKLSPVKCPYCGQSFQREDTDFVQLGRRYAHAECVEEVNQIHEYMKKVLGGSYSYTKIESQIKNFATKEGMTLDAIYKTLIYWYDVKKSSTDQANGGIGIVPYVYSEYLKYMKSQYQNAQINKNKNIRDFVGQTPTEIIGKATPIRKPRHIKFYELS